MLPMMLTGQNVERFRLLAMTASARVVIATFVGT